MKKKVLLYEWYNSSNLGDDAILLIVHDYLNNKGINFDIIYKENAKNYFELKNQYHFTYMNYISNKNKFIKKILKLYNYIIMILNNSNFLKEYNSMIFIGGGYINDIWLKELRKIYLIVILAKLIGKKVIFTGHTIGPFKKFTSKVLAKSMLKKVDSILVREKFSFQLLKSFNLNNVKLSTDDIYLYNKKLTYNSTDDYIIVNLKEFLGYNFDLMDNFIKLLLLINEKLNYKIVFIPFGINDGPNDLKYINVYIKKMQEQNIKSELYITHNLDNLFNKFYNAKLTLGMAYHSVTISLFTNTPAYSTYRGQYYKEKILGVLSHYNLEKNALNFENINDSRLKDFAQYIITTHNDEGYLKNIKRKTDNLKKLCNNNWKNIINQLKF